MNNLNIAVEQILASNKNNVATLFDLAQKTFEGAEKLVQLNLAVAQNSLNEAADQTRALLSVKDAQALQALQAGLQPSAEKFTAYSRQVADIVSALQAEFARVAQAQLNATQQEFLAAVDAASKNAPAGSENAFALFKQVVSSTNSALESVQKATKQATEVAQANIQAMAAPAAKRRAA